MRQENSLPGAGCLPATPSSQDVRARLRALSEQREERRGPKSGGGPALCCGSHGRQPVRRGVSVAQAVIGCCKCPATGAASEAAARNMDVCSGRDAGRGGGWREGLCLLRECVALSVAALETMGQHVQTAHGRRDCPADTIRVAPGGRWGEGASLGGRGVSRARK